MPRKVKQKQKQKQSQTVIVNVGTRGKRTKRQAKQTRQPPPPPQFIPYPVPQLRGPEPMVTSQPSLSQLLEALRPINAPVVGPAPLAPPPIHIPTVLSESKNEAGPEQLVGTTGAMVKDKKVLVDTTPRVRQKTSPQYSLPPYDLPPYDLPPYDFPSSSSSSSSSVPNTPSSSSSSSSSSSASYTTESSKPIKRYATRYELENMNVNSRQAGEPSLYGYASSLNITIPKFIPNTKQRPTKEFIVDFILAHTPRTIPRPKTAKSKD